jgi:4-alpha-glucanotransferase
VAYVGTHDNETAMGWFKDTATPDVREKADTLPARAAR